VRTGLDPSNKRIRAMCGVVVYVAAAVSAAQPPTELA
jgi:hypothetical protein